MVERKPHVVLSRSQKAAIIAECTRRDEEGQKWNLADVSAWAERKFDLPGRPHIATICRIRRDAPKILGAAPPLPAPNGVARQPLKADPEPAHAHAHAHDLPPAGNGTPSRVRVPAPPDEHSEAADTNGSPGETSVGGGGHKRRASDEPGETTENDSVSPVVAPLAAPEIDNSSSSVAAAAAAAAAALAAQPARKRSRRRSSADELRRWKDHGCDKNAIAVLSTSEVASALAAYLVNYEDEMTHSYDVLCDALTKRFRQNFLFGTAFADANKEGKGKLVEVVINAVAEVMGDESLFGLTNRIMRFMEALGE